VVSLISLPSAFAADPSFAGVNPPGAAVWTLPAVASPSVPADFSITITGFDAQPVEGGYVLRIPGHTFRLKPGAPDVPVLARILPGLSGYSAHVQVTESDAEDIPDVIVAPAEARVPDYADPEKPTVRTVRSASDPAYAADAFWPHDLLAVQEGSMGTQSFIRIECHPIQYNPITRTIRFHREIRAQLWFEAQGAP
jgi:hypothetical protein